MHSECYYRDANAAFQEILAAYIAVDDEDVQAQILATEQRNLEVFGYGAKGMALSLVETAITLTDTRISATDIHRVVALGRQILAHPVELLPGVVDKLDQLGGQLDLVLITKGDLLHQEQKIARSGLAKRFATIEIVSEKSPATYARILAAAKVAPRHFAMVGNSLRSDIEPVLRLGGWSVHLPYQVTWAHEETHAIAADELQRMRSVTRPSAVVEALAELQAADKNIDA